jgi:hypothetical protein
MFSHTSLDNNKCIRSLLCWCLLWGEKHQLDFVWYWLWVTFFWKSIRVLLKLQSWNWNDKMQFLVSGKKNKKNSFSRILSILFLVLKKYREKRSIGIILFSSTNLTKTVRRRWLTKCFDIKIPLTMSVFQFEGRI